MRGGAATPTASAARAPEIGVIVAARHTEGLVRGAELVATGGAGVTAMPWLARHHTTRELAPAAAEAGAKGGGEDKNLQSHTTRAPLGRGSGRTAPPTHTLQAPDLNSLQ